MKNLTAIESLNPLKQLIVLPLWIKVLPPFLNSSPCETWIFKYWVALFPGSLVCWCEELCLQSSAAGPLRTGFLDSCECQVSIPMTRQLSRILTWAHPPIVLCFEGAFQSLRIFSLCVQWEVVKVFMCVIGNALSSSEIQGMATQYPSLIWSVLCHSRLFCHGSCPDPEISSLWFTSKIHKF